MLDENHLVGIITANDFVRVAARALALLEMLNASKKPAG